ncbi:hypothetical protein [Herpetosiphon giganteus]|uniref:hypothetical protein n=1 Tax=Herpetosiphon giganteus TaxID=2029754 RepID=UPI001959FB66|nr:hypothetical protein [Herpetosiphon giganteus]MBM7843087.1 hypothetical protein [Herpetosiphon giganteus]
MIVYKSPAAKYLVPFVVIFVAATIVLINQGRFFWAGISCVFALIFLGLIGLSYKLRFVTAADYMQVDRFGLDKKINWTDIIAIEAMKYESGMYLLRAINKNQMFNIPILMFKRRDILEIMQYLNRKSVQYQIPFNHNIPYLKSMYYHYNPRSITKISNFLPTLLPKTTIPIFGVFTVWMISFGMLLKQIKEPVSTNADLDLLLLTVILILIYGWVHLLFAQFPQNLRAIEHNQRKQHDQIFVPTVASSQTYRLPFVLVSVALVIAIGGFMWYLTH